MSDINDLFNRLKVLEYFFQGWECCIVILVVLYQDMVMMEKPSPIQVGREFVRQYYTLLNKAPALLHRFDLHCNCIQ